MGRRLFVVGRDVSVVMQAIEFNSVGHWEMQSETVAEEKVVV